MLDNVGAVLSIVTLLLAAVFPFSASSLHTFSSIDTVCFPSFVVFTTNVYSLSLTFVNVPFVPFSTFISSAVKSVTSLLNVNVYVISFALLKSPVFAVILHTGTFLSIVTVLLASLFPFPASSVHAFAFMLTVCSQLSVFVTTILYVFSSTFVNSPFVPFVTSISSAVNPLTFSLNVNVYVILSAFVGFPLGSAVIVAVGAVLSIVVVLLISLFPFPASSVHAFSATFTVCSPLPVLVTTILYVLSSTFVNSPFSPFVTSISSIVKSVTFSLNVNVYVISSAFVGLSLGSAVISHVGTVLSNTYGPNT